MPYKGYKAVTISEEAYNRLKQAYQKETADQKVKLSLSKWTEKYLWGVIERSEAWRDYMPYLEAQNIEDSGILLKDNRLSKLVQLRLHDGDLYCDVDCSSDCVHVGFAWAIPEVYKIMKAHGRKPPT